MTRGRIFARLAWVNGCTRLVEHHQNAPLKIARCFETEGGGLEICVMDASPGLLAGDCNDFEWILEAGARLRVITQGATRIHPSSGPISRQNLRFQVAAGARLEIWPQTTIPFRAARFESKISGHLEAGAQLLLLDLLSSGRIARGESFEFEAIDSRIHLFGASGPLLCTQNRFVPAESRLQNALSWGDATQIGNLLCFGGADEKRVVIGAQQILSAEAANRVSGAVSSLARGGVAVAMRGQRAHDLQRVAAAIARQWRDDGVC